LTLFYPYFIVRVIEMKMYVKAILLLLVFMPMNACSTAPTSTPASNPQGDYPLDTKTGVQAVDNALAAVASGNSQELISLINYTIAPCITADGLGGPPKCSEGEPEGMMLEVLPFLGGEGSFIRKSEIGNWQGVDATAVYAVYRVSQDAQVEEYYSPGKYAIIFIAPGNQPMLSLRIANGGIVQGRLSLG
jgi:hypothetical protein